MGVNDFARAQLTWPDWLQKLLTHPVRSLENYEKLVETLTTGEGVIKVCCQVSS
jgi:hypothetical protein